MEDEAERIYKDERGLLLDDEAASTRDAMWVAMSSYFDLIYSIFFKFFTQSLPCWIHPSVQSSFFVVWSDFDICNTWIVSLLSYQLSYNSSMPNFIKTLTTMTVKVKVRSMHDNDPTIFCYSNKLSWSPCVLRFSNEWKYQLLDHMCFVVLNFMKFDMQDQHGKVSLN